MARLSSRPHAGLLVLWLVGLAPTLRAEPGAPLPPADQVVAQLVRRAEDNARRDATLTYRWKRVQTLERLDARAGVRDRQTTEWQVVQKAGERVITPLEGDDAHADTRRDQEGRGGHRPTRRDWLVPEVFNRFQFTTVGREEVDGRPCLVLGMVPRQGQAADSVSDKVVGSLQGRIWVEETTGELARASVRLPERVRFWGGMLGHLDRLDIHLERRPLPSGRWFEHRMQVWVDGHFPFRNLRFRTREEVREVEITGPSPPPAASVDAHP